MAGSASTLRAEDGVPKETPLFASARNFEDLDDRMFPLAWSAEGKFAWLCMESNEAADKCTWLVTIQDMKTNKAVAREKFVMPDAPVQGIAQLWDAHGKAITDLLEKHAVKPEARLTAWRQWARVSEIIPACWLTLSNKPDRFYKSSSGYMLRVES